jgi:hypothetical protein
MSGRLFWTAWKLQLPEVSFQFSRESRQHRKFRGLRLGDRCSVAVQVDAGSGTFAEMTSARCVVTARRTVFTRFCSSEIRSMVCGGCSRSGALMRRKSNSAACRSNVLGRSGRSSFQIMTIGAREGALRNGRLRPGASGRRCRECQPCNKLARVRVRPGRRQEPQR